MYGRNGGDFQTTIRIMGILPVRFVQETLPNTRCTPCTKHLLNTVNLHNVAIGLDRSHSILLHEKFDPTRFKHGPENRATPNWSTYLNNWWFDDVQKTNEIKQVHHPSRSHINHLKCEVNYCQQMHRSTCTSTGDATVRLLSNPTQLSVPVNFAKRSHAV
jgi:hypothetical protein